MKKLLTNNWLLITILLLATALRFMSLGSIPPGLTQDEASLGYNAYSILKTGKDEYGKVMPVIFKSFGDYKPGLYVYLDVPFVVAFGLNEVAVRLPSALAGVLIVYLIYLIVNRLFDKKPGIFAAFVASVTPWLIFYSRGAWEANVSLMLTLAAIYFFLRALESQKFLLVSTSLFALTLWTYQGAKLSSAIVFLILIILYWRKIVSFKSRDLAASILLPVIISIPIILSLFNGQTGRLDVFSIFSYPRPKDYTQVFLNEGNEKFGSLSYDLFHSESLNFTRGILGRYFNHFSAKFLFFQGDYQNPQHSAPYQGMLLISDMVLLLVGLVVIVRQKLNKGIVFIILWLIFSPLPAVLTRDQVQSVRALNMAVPLVIISAFGLSVIYKYIQTSKFRTLLNSLIIILYSGSILYFLDAYYIHVPNHNSSYWNYGYEQVVQKVTPIQSNYKNVIVEQSFAQPYIYFLFYQKYNPAKYQKQAELSNSDNARDVGLVDKLDNISFQKIDWSQIRNQHDTLVVVDGVTGIPGEVSYDTIGKIYYLNGRDLAFQIIKIQ
jgi:4-amino-4-deoxy-L-arabinose transferase-like glycosyltransferase